MVEASVEVDVGVPWGGVVLAEAEMGRRMDGARLSMWRSSCGWADGGKRVLWTSGGCGVGSGRSTHAKDDVGT
jgi:hypothetical protein